MCRKRGENCISLGILQSFVLSQHLLRFCRSQSFQYVQTLQLNSSSMQEPLSLHFYKCDYFRSTLNSTNEPIHTPLSDAISICTFDK